MTVDASASNGPPHQGRSRERSNRASLRWKPRLVAALVLAIACHQSNDFGVLPAPGPRGVIVAPVRDYPFGDAVDVYRAALDMLYVDGDERPSIIVMPDSLEILPGCYLVARCSGVWPGKSVVDTSTYHAFMSGPRVQPRIRNFGYRIPIHLQSHSEQADIWNAGLSYDSAHPPLPGKMAEGPNGGFRRHYPGAWGVAAFSLVGFNPTHTEAILQVRQGCGAQCYSDELVFFRRAGDRWRPVERLAQTVMADWIQTRLSYRGPLVKNPGESQLLVDKAGAPLRTEGQDAPSIYRLVVDSLYSFHGGHPRMIVVSGQHARAQDAPLPFKHQIDSSTRAAFTFVSSITDRMSAFSPRLPMVEMTKDSMDAFEREGIPLQKEAQAKIQDYESSPFWLAFRKHYPLAWGYVELSRIGFNPDHTQALVYVTHWCGDGCMSGDIWFLTRTGENWTVAETSTRYGDAVWSRDSLRYIGRGADPNNYQPRRAQGVVSSFETGAVLPDFEITFAGTQFLKTVRTDAVGHFIVNDLPFDSPIYFRALCPVPGRSEKAAGDYLRMTHPGMDTTANVQIPFRACTHLNRANPLIGGAPADPGLPVTRPPASIAGVYAGVLDALYPPDVRDAVPIMVEQFDTRRCGYCIEPEVPRLVRKGMLDPTTDDEFTKARIDSAVPVFPYRRKLEAMPMWDLYWLGPGNGRDWTAMKDAYPGIKSVVSFARVGFNSRGTQALVEFHVDSAGSEATSETMLLEKTGAAWRVALRHVEGPATSGEWADGKCEAGDAPASAPTRAEIEKLAGEFKIVRVGASRAFRGRTDTLRVRLEPLKASPTKPSKLVGPAVVLGATGEPDDKIAVEFSSDQSGTAIEFSEHVPAGHVILDGWYEEYRILRTVPGGFVGTWLTESGPVIPWRGYFCARSARAR
jgi:hypothetical protein